MIVATIYIAFAVARDIRAPYISDTLSRAVEVGHYFITRLRVDCA